MPDPDVVIADEPVSALDVSIARRSYEPDDGFATGYGAVLCLYLARPVGGGTHRR